MAFGRTFDYDSWTIVGLTRTAGKFRNLSDETRTDARVIRPRNRSGRARRCHVAGGQRARRGPRRVRAPDEWSSATRRAEEFQFRYYSAPYEWTIITRNCINFNASIRYKYIYMITRNVLRTSRAFDGRRRPSALHDSVGYILNYFLAYFSRPGLRVWRINNNRRCDNRRRNKNIIHCTVTVV